MHIYTYMYTYMYMYVHMYVYMYVCTCRCMYTSIHHVYVHKDKSPCYCQMVFAFILYLAGSSYITVMLAELQAGQRTHARQSAPQTTYNIFLN